MQGTLLFHSDHFEAPAAPVTGLLFHPDCPRAMRPVESPRRFTKMRKKKAAGSSGPVVPLGNIKTGGEPVTADNGRFAATEKGQPATYPSYSRQWVACRRSRLLHGHFHPSHAKRGLEAGLPPAQLHDDAFAVLQCNRFRTASSRDPGTRG
jgi:hypothetical protein